MKNKAYIARPWTFKFEMSMGCNLKCKFCPVYATPSLQDPAKRRFMDPKKLRAIARSCNELNPTARIELAMRGEPTLNPQILENMRILREEMPKAQISMFSNGTTFLQGKLGMNDLIDAGVNILCVDCYNGTYKRFESMAKLQAGDDITVQDFRKFSAYGRHSGGHRMRTIVLVPDIGDKDKAGKPLVRVREIHNNAGNADADMLLTHFDVPALEEPLEKKCARPFREFVVNYDGSVVICCHDWKSKDIMGWMPKQSAAEIWYGDKHLQILRALYRKDRSHAPCDTCDYKGGFRLGFLQDPFKKKA